MIPRLFSGAPNVVLDLLLAVSTQLRGIVDVHGMSADFV